nr:MAG TPA: hypothetical protein [Caudoviricetes sp.]
MTQGGPPPLRPKPPPRHRANIPPRFFSTPGF